MNKKASFHELAEFELNDAALFFESKTAGLGVRFLSAVEKAIAEIKLHPESSQIILKEVRRKVVRKFPYSIFFTIKHDHLRILAIANQKRRPFYWHGRT
ncbi:MAG TPA: hypothetical protein VFM63_14775 [Pyrinomonadaceae bacterium]|nr:hypothetical protein [Pyrinomonadaceae bacterium]